MDLKLKLIDNTNDVLDFKASFVDGRWYGIRNNKKYIVNIPINICNILYYIFSSHTNDKWPVGTVKTHTKLNQKDYIDYGWWTPFKQGITIKGVLNAASRIDVNWKLQQTVSKNIYEQSNRRRTITE